MDKATELKNLGNKAFTEKRFEESVDYFTQAININPNDHVFYSNRSGAYASLEKYTEVSIYFSFLGPRRRHQMCEPKTRLGQRLLAKRIGGILSRKIRRSYIYL